MTARAHRGEVAHWIAEHAQRLATLDPGASLADLEPRGELVRHGDGLRLQPALGDEGERNPSSPMRHPRVTSS